jgi:hypothetical protein
MQPYHRRSAKTALLMDLLMSALLKARDVKTGQMYLTHFKAPIARGVCLHLSLVTMVHNFYRSNTHHFYSATPISEERGNLWNDGIPFSSFNSDEPWGGLGMTTAIWVLHHYIGYIPPKRGQVCVINLCNFGPHYTKLMCLINLRISAR